MKEVYLIIILLSYVLNVNSSSSNISDNYSGFNLKDMIMLNKKYNLLSKQYEYSNKILFEIDNLKQSLKKTINILDKEKYNISLAHNKTNELLYIDDNIDFQYSDKFKMNEDNIIYETDSDNVYDLDNRIIINNIIGKFSNISAYTVLNFKPMSKMDNGYFSTILFIVYCDGILYGYDSRETLLFKKDTSVLNYKIEKLINFNSNEENVFYGIIKESNNNNNNNNNYGIMKFFIHVTSRNSVINRLVDYDNFVLNVNNTTNTNKECSDVNNDVDKCNDKNIANKSLYNINYLDSSNKNISNQKIIDLANTYNIDYVSHNSNNESIIINTFIEDEKSWEIEFNFNRNRIRNSYSIKEIDILYNNNNNNKEQDSYMFNKTIDKINSNIYNDLLLGFIRSSNSNKLNINYYNYLYDTQNNTNIILNIIPFLNKGKRTIIIETNYNIFYANDNLSIIKTFNKKEIYFSLNISIDNPQIKQIYCFFGFCSIYFNNYNKMFILDFDNLNSITLEIEFKKNIKIKGFIYDQFTNLLYIVTSDFNLLFIIPKIVSREEKTKNSYSVAYKINLIDDILIKKSNVNKSKFNLIKEIDNDISIQIIKKDLIVKVDDILFLIDLEQAAAANNNNNNSYEGNIKDVNTNYILLNKHNNNNNEYFLNNFNNLIYLKNQNSLYLTTISNVKLNKNEYKAIVFYDVVVKNKNIVGGNNFDFNFKIPVIFIALVILVIYHVFYKNKNNKQHLDDDKVKDELIKELTKHNAFNDKKILNDKFTDKKQYGEDINDTNYSRVKKTNILKKSNYEEEKDEDVNSIQENDINRYNNINEYIDNNEEEDDEEEEEEYDENENDISLNKELI